MAGQLRYCSLRCNTLKQNRTPNQRLQQGIVSAPSFASGFIRCSPPSVVDCFYLELARNAAYHIGALATVLESRKNSPISVASQGFEADCEPSLPGMEGGLRIEPRRNQTADPHARERWRTVFHDQLRELLGLAASRVRLRTVVIAVAVMLLIGYLMLASTSASRAGAINAKQPQLDDAAPTEPRVVIQRVPVPGGAPQPAKPQAFPRILHQICAFFARLIARSIAAD